MAKSKQISGGPTVNDEICYCERCGVSFLWTIEEQDRLRQQVEALPAARGAPTHCPGCRRLLPTGQRERGLVKWYNSRKRFGFIVRTSGNELFAHGSALKGTRTLNPGDLVEFDVQESERGEAACEIILLQPAEPAG